MVLAQVVRFRSTSIKDSLNTVIGALNDARKHVGREKELEDLHRRGGPVPATECAGQVTCKFIPLRCH